MSVMQCLFTTATVTKNNEFGGLKSHKCITFLFWKSGVQNGLIEPQSICWRGWLLPEGLQGSPLATYTGHLYSLAHNPLSAHLKVLIPTLPLSLQCPDVLFWFFLFAHGVALACIREGVAIWLFIEGMPSFSLSLVCVCACSVWWCIHVYMHICACMSAYACTCMCVCVCSIWWHIHVHVHTFAWMSACMCVRMCMRVCICVCVGGRTFGVFSDSPL